jgi:hypothetical protein
VDPAEPDEPVDTAGPGADDPDPPEGAVPGSAVPEGAVPEGAVPGSAVPGSAVPEGAVPEGAVPEGAVPEGAVPEAAVPEGAVPEAADDPTVPDPCLLDGNPWDPTAEFPDHTSRRAARCPGGVGAGDGPLWLCDGTAQGATGTEGPGTGVTPPTTGSWLDDRGTDGRTWIDTVAIMTKMTAAAEKKNTGSVLPAG